MSLFYSKVFIECLLGAHDYDRVLGHKNNFKKPLGWLYVIERFLVLKFGWNMCKNRVTEIGLNLKRIPQSAFFCLLLPEFQAKRDILKL